MYWANLFHIYQPPGQKKEITQKVARESYSRIVDILKRRPNTKISLNINASLAEQLPSAGLTKLLKDISVLARRGQIEFTGSAKYHVILSLLPEREIIRQIELNEKTNRKFFGNIWRPTGFFIPELCYSDKVARLVKKLGYKWIILDEIACRGNFGKMKFDKQYIIEKIGLPVFFRNTRISNLFFTAEAKTVEDFLEIVKDDERSKKYLLTAGDGENLGHHQKEMDELYASLLDSGNFAPINFSDLLKIYKQKQGVKPLPSSWSSRTDELKKNLPYPLWKNPKNEIHRKQWQLTNLAIETVEAAGKDPFYARARRRLDQALHSDQYWWASANPWWSVEIIENGANMLFDAVSILKNCPKPTILKAKTLRDQISSLAHKWQDSRRAKKIRAAYLAGEPYERYFAGKIIK